MRGRHNNKGDCKKFRKKKHEQKQEEENQKKHLCPTPNFLRLYAQKAETLLGCIMEHIENHLEGCARCRRMVQSAKSMQYCPKPTR